LELSIVPCLEVDRTNARRFQVITTSFWLANSFYNKMYTEKKHSKSCNNNGYEQKNFSILGS